MLNSNYKNTKRGFGGVASTLIMFIAIIGVTTGMVMSFQNYFLQTKDTLNYQQQQTNEKLKTFITITHTYYDAPGTNLRVYLKNTGSTNLKASYIDMFVNGEYGTNLTPYYAGTTDLVNILKQTQTMYIDYDVSLPVGSHNVRVVTELGVSDDEDFNVN
jgi:archaellum component FlaF (FlaF/FlaG flagellin family)